MELKSPFRVRAIKVISFIFGCTFLFMAYIFNTGSIISDMLFIAYTILMIIVSIIRLNQLKLMSSTIKVRLMNYALKSMLPTFLSFIFHSLIIGILIYKESYFLTFSWWYIFYTEMLLRSESNKFWKALTDEIKNKLMDIAIIDLGYKKDDKESK